jgi:hypothetical protein
MVVEQPRAGQRKKSLHELGCLKHIDTSIAVAEEKRNEDDIDMCGGGADFSVEEESATVAPDPVPPDEGVADDDEEAAAVEHAAPPDPGPPESASSPNLRDDRDGFSWLLMFVKAWSIRHRISDGAVKQLLLALKMFFELLRVVAAPGGIGPGSVQQPGQWPSSFATWSECKPVQPRRVLLCPNPVCGAARFEDDVKKEWATLFPAAEAQPCCVQIKGHAVQAPLTQEPPSMSTGRCGTRLYKVADRPDETPTAVPLKLCPFFGIISGLRRLFLRPDFEEKCELWRSDFDPQTWQRKSDVEETVISDVWHGSLWRSYLFLDEHTKPAPRCMQVEDRNHQQPPRNRGASSAAAAAAASSSSAAAPRFLASSAAAAAAASSSSAASRFGRMGRVPPAVLSVPGPLLAASGTLALQLNMDGLQVHRNGSYSMHAIYVVVLNLPREERYLAENVILVALLPGPRHPAPSQLQSTMRLVNEEFAQLLVGVQMPTFLEPSGKEVRAFKFNIVADSPARAQLIGSPQTPGRRYCFCCQQIFPSRGDGDSCTDFSPSVTDVHAPADTDQRRRHFATEWAKQPSELLQEAHFKVHGCRYVALMDLPYFDAVRCAPIDVMHALDLGVTKALFFALRETADVSSTCQEVKQRLLEAIDSKFVVNISSASFFARHDEYHRKQGKEQTFADQAATLSSAGIGFTWTPKHLEASKKSNSNESFCGCQITLDSVLPIPAAKRSAQNYLANCMGHPRGVDKIGDRIHSGGNFKAAEWRQWAQIYAVPMHSEFMRAQQILAAGKNKIRTAIREKFFFRQRHLEILITLRALSIAAHSYSFTPQKISKLREDAWSLARQTENLFGQRAVRGNHHLLLHLADHIEECGPAAGFSCYPFERYNLLVANVPMSPSHVTLCCARRFSNLTEISCAMAAIQCDDVERPGLASRKHYAHVEKVLSGVTGEAESQHGVIMTTHRSANNEVQHRYKWPSQNDYWTFMRAQAGQMQGCEPIPMCWLDEAQQLDWSLPNEVLKLNKLCTPNGYKSTTQPRRLEHLKDCLMAHYKRVYKLDGNAFVTSKLFVHHQVDIAGVKFGAGNSSHARITSIGTTEGDAQPAPWFGRALFYFTHSYRPPNAPIAIEHSFVFMDWHWNQESLELKPYSQPDSPFLRKLEYKKNLFDLIAVQSISGRWIEHRSGGRIQALSVPFKTKIHC